MVVVEAPVAAMLVRGLITMPEGVPVRVPLVRWNVGVAEIVMPARIRWPSRLNVVMSIFNALMEAVALRRRVLLRRLLPPKLNTDLGVGLRNGQRSDACSQQSSCRKR